MVINAIYTIYDIDETQPGNSIIVMKAPNGTLYKLVVDNAGVLSTAVVTE